jgi:hypothetical protein
MTVQFFHRACPCRPSLLGELVPELLNVARVPAINALDSAWTFNFKRPEG